STKKMEEHSKDGGTDSQPILPLYHVAGMTGYDMAVAKGSKEGDGKFGMQGPVPVQEQADSSMTWWAANMHKRFYNEAY
ncbi:MAG: hypothetical protein Q9169_008539, partial [Polycauliona sp. 2 TL-2023]